MKLRESLGPEPESLRVHDRVPPGVPTLKKKKSAVHWVYEPTELGARIVISTTDARALKAVHDFLRFQIEDHRTADSEAIAD